MVGAQPDHEALVEVQTGRRWTYHQLAEEVDTLALGLLATGIVKGDRGDWQPDSPHPRNSCVFAVSR
jgi:fatty-acyl-CoA synthase